MAMNRGRGLGDPLTAGVPAGFVQTENQASGLGLNSVRENQGSGLGFNSARENQGSAFDRALEGSFSFPRRMGLGNTDFSSIDFNALGHNIFGGAGLSGFPNADPFDQDTGRGELEDLLRNLFGGRSLQERSSTSLPSQPGLRGGVTHPDNLGRGSGMDPGFLAAIMGLLGQSGGAGLSGGFGVPFQPGPFRGF